MSSVDERVVKMVFDNSEFSNKIGQTLQSLQQLNKSTDEIANNSKGLSALGQAFQSAEVLSTQAGFKIRDVWLKVADIFEQQVASRIVSTVSSIKNAMTFEGINDGFKEYELKMGSIQTIMAGTGEALQTVDKYLDELNTYSDKTIYSFADMTNNIGKFTNAGVKLEDAVLAIKGVANEAAISGANANEASRAMYNFSQALSAGYVKLIDWKSIENANMATKAFKDTLLEVASTVGTVEKQSNGMYKVLGKNANGATMKELVSGTKNFNDSLAYQWMTTEVLTKTMKLYSTDLRDLSEAEKEAFRQDLGMNEEQFKQFETLGARATDAASEIKTFTMLMDTLKEAIGSGWAMTWQLILGDFEKAKSLWTEVGSVLGGVIDAQASYRNDALKLWDSVGGRTDLIDAMRNSFEALKALLAPISQGMKEVFPKYTYRTLKDISEGIKEFTTHLKISGETADKIRKVTHGFFATIDIGIKFVKAFVGALTSAGPTVGNLAGGLLDVAANLGQFIYKLDETITRTKLFERIFSDLGSVVQPIFDKLTSGASAVLGFFKELFGSFTGSENKLESVGDVFHSIMEGLSNGINSIKEHFEKIKPFFDGLLTIVKAAGTAIVNVFKQIGSTLTGFKVDGSGLMVLTNIMNTLLTGGILSKLFNVGDALENFGDFFDTFGEILEGFEMKVKASTLISIASAIGVLALSLTLVASIDSSKLLGATTAISAMIVLLTGSMAALMKAVSSFSTADVSSKFTAFGKSIFGFDAAKTLQMAKILKAVAAALIGMGAAVLMMSVGLKIVSSAAENGHLWDSWAVVSLMLAELTGVAILLGKFSGEATNGAKNLKGMTTALILMAVALKMVSEVTAGGNYMDAVGIITLFLLELTGVSLLLSNFGGNSARSMISLISMAISLNLLVVALKTVSDAMGQDGNHILAALGVITIMLTELTAVTILMSKFGAFAALGGVGALLGVTSLLIMVQALKQVSDLLGQTDNHVWASLGVIGVALLELVVGVTAMNAAIPGAIAMGVVSAALVVLAGALKIMGSMSVPEMAKALLTLGLSLTFLAVGLTAMVAAIPGALALTVAAAGLTLLAGALKVLGSMKLWEIVKALLTLVSTLLIVGTIATVFSVVTPLILLFSAAMVGMGAGILAVGLGITLFASGLQSLIAILPVGAAALKVLLTTLLELVPVLVGALADTIGILASKIVEYAPVIGQAVLAILETVLSVIAGAAMKIGETVLMLLVAIMTVITQHIPQIAKLGADMIVAFVTTISNEVPRVVDAGFKLAIALINGLADAIENNNGDLLAAIDHLMDAVLQALGQWVVECTPIGMLIPENIKEGIASGEFNIKQAAEDLINGFVQHIKDFVKNVFDAGAELGNKLIEGIRSKKGIDAHSPSRKGEEAVLDTGDGMVKGGDKAAPAVKEAGAKLGGELINGVTESIKDGVGDASDALGNLDVSLDNSAESINKASKAADNFKDAMKGTSEATSEATETTKKHSKTIEENSDAIKKSHGKVELLYDQLNDNIKAEEKLTKTTEDNTEEVDKNTEAQEANAKATGKSSKATKATKDHAEVMEYANGVVEAFVKNYGDMYKGLGEDAPVKVATLAVKNLAEATYKASLSAKDAAEENKKTKATIEDMIKSFTELKTKIYDSVKSMFEGDNFFQKFELKTEMSMQTILENMKSNVDGVASWTHKIAELGKKGLNEGLLKQLAELGPKGYEYVNAFSNATTEQIAEANTRFAEASALPGVVSDQVVASYALAGLNAVTGFMNGIDENAAQAAISAENLGLTTLQALMTALEEHSPSQATWRDGMYLDQGLGNGIEENRWMAQIPAFSLCQKIIAIFESNLQASRFYPFGANIAIGLAEGMMAHIGEVEAAARALSEAAANVTVDFNGIHSPADRYINYGGNMAKGLANGMIDGVSDVQHGALVLSESIQNMLNSVSEDDMTLHPVIEPVLDLSNVRRNASLIGGLMPTRSIGIASSISIGRQVSGTAQNGGTSEAASSNQINFTQNNYSPKALSRQEIYRQTKNQLSMMKGVVQSYV